MRYAAVCWLYAYLRSMILICRTSYQFGLIIYMPMILRLSSSPTNHRVLLGRNQLRWAGHLLRMLNNRTLKTFLQDELAQGSRADSVPNLVEHAVHTNHWTSLPRKKTCTLSMTVVMMRGAHYCRNRSPIAIHRRHYPTKVDMLLHVNYYSTFALHK